MLIARPIRETSPVPAPSSVSPAAAAAVAGPRDVAGVAEASVEADGWWWCSVSEEAEGDRFSRNLTPSAAASTAPTLPRVAGVVSAAVVARASATAVASVAAAPPAAIKLTRNGCPSVESTVSVHSRHCDGGSGGGGGGVGTLLSCFALLLAFFFRVEPFSAFGAIGSVLPPTETAAAAVEVFEAAGVKVALTPAVAAGAFVPAAWMFFATSTSCSGVQKIDLRFLDGSELSE